jgi:hypothetical protein
MYSALNFEEYFMKCIAKVYQWEVELKHLYAKYGISQRNIRTIMIVNVQTTILFRSEIWWKNEKDRVAKSKQ